MSELPNNQGHESEAAIEALFAEAEPRPVPSPDATLLAKKVVREAWEKRVRRKRTLRRVAVAASIAVATMLAIQLQPTPSATLPQFAVVERLDGVASKVGDNGRLDRIGTGAAIRIGETIRTEYSAGLALDWHQGGSLRLDEHSEIVFVADNEIKLNSGRIYYDSKNDRVDAHSLLVRTELGVVEHRGTQFMTEIRDSDALSVSVREGEVSINGRYHQAVAEAGQQVILRGNRRPEERRINTYGADWEWIASVSPSVDTTGMSIHDVLMWVQKETGLTIRYETEAARKEAIRVVVSGMDEIDNPMVALRNAAAIADLMVNREEGNGVIRISL